MKKPSKDSINKDLYGLIAHRLGTVDPKDVIYIDPKTKNVFVAGEQLSAQQANSYAAEARVIKSTQIYKNIVKAIEHQSRLIMTKSIDYTKPEETGLKSIFSVAMLHDIGIIETIINACEGFPAVLEERMKEEKNRKDNVVSIKEKSKPVGMS